VLAASDAEAPAGTLIKQYARRWTIDIDQAWRLSRIKWWVGSARNEAFWGGDTSWFCISVPSKSTRQIGKR
jgi:hypothetical protein